MATSDSISLSMQRLAEKEMYNTSGIHGEQEELFDEISAPKHYARWRIQPYEFISQNKLEFWRGNIIKYVMRAGYKGNSWETEIKDLEKAKQYIHMRITDIKGDELGV